MTRFFKNNGPFTLSTILEIAEVKLVKEINQETLITDVAALDKATNTEISFFANNKYLSDFQASGAGFCITSEENAAKAPAGMVVLIAKNPYFEYAKVATLFYKEQLHSEYRAASSIINPTAEIGKNCFIGENVVIEAGVEIGDNTKIDHNSVIHKNVKIGNHCIINSLVRISHAEIGDNVTIHTGVKIGQDGFGFAMNGANFFKVPQLGSVIIGNNVEIGANTCIDRGSFSDTIIGDNSQIDNLVQIGHNVELGKNCVIVSQVGISGSTILEDFVVIGGQVGIAGHLKLACGVQVAAKSGVTNSVLVPGTKMAGYPALPGLEWHRQNAAIKKLIKKGDK